MLAILATFAPLAIRWAEAHILSTPEKKAGTDRKALVSQMLRSIAQLVIARGETGDAPLDETLAGFIEAIYQRMKSSGELTAPLDDAETAVLLIRGRVQRLTGGTL